MEDEERELYSVRWQSKLHEVKNKYKLSDEITSELYMVIALVQRDLKEKIIGDIENI